MTTKQKDGGAAFPNSHPLKLASGMTLRQWYAGMALQGLIACPLVRGVVDGKENGDAVVVIASEACDYADAIIAELGDKE